MEARKMKKQPATLEKTEKNVHVEIVLGKFKVRYGILVQCWELGEPPYSHKVQGEELDILKVSQEWILAFQKAIVATSEFTRVLQPLLQSKHLNKVWVEISSEEIILRVFLAKGAKKELLLCYRAIDGFLVIQTEQQSVFGRLPVDFESTFKEICLGRYGLLQRLLHRAVQGDTSASLEGVYEGRRETA